MIQSNNGIPAYMNVMPAGNDGFGMGMGGGTWWILIYFVLFMMMGGNWGNNNNTNIS